MAQKGNEILAPGGDCEVSSPGQDMVDMRKTSTAAKSNTLAKHVATPAAAGQFSLDAPGTPGTHLEQQL